MPVYRFGLVQLAQAPLSRAHSKRLPDSVALKVKLASVALVGLLGPLPMVVSGGVRSMRQLWLAGIGSVLPAASVARTRKLWLPSPSPV